MTFDIFAALAQPGFPVAVHNVRLVAVQPDAAGHELLTVEHAGITRELPGSGPWSEEHSRRNVGRFGYVVAARPFDRELPAGACHFRDYIDQSLRRVPELDCNRRDDSDDGRAQDVVGWYCEAKPYGFRAPFGIIPGESGRFVHDETVAVTLRVPPEFVRECQRVQMTPEGLLRSFVGDLAGVINSAACPRADGYGSNGSDEREYADAWYERAHGMNAIDMDAQEDARFEAEEQQFRRDDFADLLDEFESHGGQSEELFALVAALVEKQAANDGA